MTTTAEDEILARVEAAAAGVSSDVEALDLAAQIRAVVREARDAQAGVRRQGWATPGDLAMDLFRAKTVQTDALRLIDQDLVELADTPDGRLIITMPFQEGKSTRVSRDYPLWLLSRNPDLRMVTASYGKVLARRNGRLIRNAIRDYPELGLQIAADNGSATEWQVAGHEGGMFAVGIGGAIVGRPADFMVIDDPIKNRKEADSEVYRETVWDWWLNDAAGRLAPGAPVVLILTRWHEDDLAGRLLNAPDGHLWKVRNIAAQADHDPDAGEVDPLGREPGEYLVSARGRTVEQWEATKLRSGSRVWTASYQGRPTAPGGTLFKRNAWRYYELPQWTVDEYGRHVPYGFDATLVSWDMTFKDKDTSDLVVGTVWGRRGGDFYLLDLVRARMDFVASAAAVKNLWAKWPTVGLKLVEDKANGSAILAYLAHEVVGIVGEEPNGSKYARASAVAPLVEARQVYLPDPKIAPWVGDYVEELAGFPTAKHDDQVDSTSQALNRLALMPVDADSGLAETDDYADDQRGGFSPI